jgi:hypothetical protein
MRLYSQPISTRVSKAHPLQPQRMTVFPSVSLSFSKAHCHRFSYDLLISANLRNTTVFDDIDHYEARQVHESIVDDWLRRLGKYNAHGIEKLASK